MPFFCYSSWKWINKLTLVIDNLIPLILSALIIQCALPSLTSGIIFIQYYCYQKINMTLMYKCRLILNTILHAIHLILSSSSTILFFTYCVLILINVLYSILCTFNDAFRILLKATKISQYCTDRYTLRPHLYNASWLHLRCLLGYLAKASRQIWWGCCDRAIGNVGQT